MMELCLDNSQSFCIAAFAVRCASKSPVAFVDNPFPLLVWLGEFTRPAGTVYPQLPDSAKFGSISGLAPDPATKQWVAAIDDREQIAHGLAERDDGPKGLDVTPVACRRCAPGRAFPSASRRNPISRRSWRCRMAGS